MLDVSSTFDSFPVLQTERCILREIRPDDIQDVFEFMSDDSVTKYLPWDTVTTIDAAVEQLQRYLDFFEDKTGIAWGIVNKANNKLMGTCLLFHFDLANHRAEIGYVLGSKWWRQGFVMEVASEVVRYAFDDMNFHSLAAIIDPDNVGSEKVLEKIGFVREAYFRENYYNKSLVTFTDTAIYSLLKSEWGK